MTTNLASPPVSAPMVTFVSLNTRRVARGMAPLPEPETRAYIDRVIQTGGGDIRGLCGFRSRVRRTHGSAQFEVSMGRREVLSALVVWDGNELETVRMQAWLSQVGQSLGRKQWPSAIISSLNPQTVPWVATLYRPEIRSLVLHEATGLVVFQRDLVAVLLDGSGATTNHCA